MSSDFAVRAQGLGKVYRLYAKPVDRLKQMLFLGRRHYGTDFVALHDVNLELRHGDILGLVGRNGAGKSTLLQLICGTLAPTAGSVTVNGRVAALLELGAGFNPEFTGRENVFLYASVLGLTRAEIEARYDDIVAFSGIGDFIHQPVKTYSSGMYVRLAFAVATSVDPDILVIDEALSVGDGEFARRSFDRIMAMKQAGKTILFCSHSMYQIEALCNRAIWLDGGRVAMLGSPADVTSAYGATLAASSLPHGESLPTRPSAGDLRACIRLVEAGNGTDTPDDLLIHSGRDNLEIRVAYDSDPRLPAPSVALGLLDATGRWVASIGSVNDGVSIARDAAGRGEVLVRFPKLPLLKGEYTIDAYVMCENGIHVYDAALACRRFSVTQDGLEQGIVTLPREWVPAR